MHHYIYNKFTNLKFVIAYDGSLYQGSQKQPNGLTVEDKLLKAFKKINIETNIVLSGRIKNKRAIDDMLSAISYCDSKINNKF